MISKEAVRVELVSGGNVIKQGDETTLVFQFRNELGEIVDLTNAKVKIIIANSTKRVLEKDATVENNQMKLQFTKDDVVTGGGEMRMEFHVTQGGKVRRFPSDGRQRIRITATLENVEIGGVPFVTAQEIKKVTNLAQTAAEEAKTDSETALLQSKEVADQARLDASQAKTDLTRAKVDSNEAKTNSVEALGKANKSVLQSQNTQAQVNNLVVKAGDSSPQVLQALTNASGETFDTLKEVLDDKDNKIDVLSENIKNISVPLTNYCVLDGVADDTDGVEEAYQEAKARNQVLYLPSGKILRVTRDVSLHGVNLEFYGRIKVDFNGTGITIGGMKVRQYIRQANSTNAKWITLRMIGGYQSQFDISECTYLQIWADSDMDSRYGGTIPYASFTAYSVFNFQAVPRLEFNCNPNPKDPSILQWVNENTFNRGAYRNLLMLSDSLVPNNNVFDHPTFEDSTLLMESGSTNHFRDCRFEGTKNVITLRKKTNDNIIEKLYTETILSSFSDGLGSGTTVTDEGSGNIISRSQWEFYDMKELFSLTARNSIFNTSADVEGYKGGVQAGIHKLKVVSNYKQVYKSTVIPLPTYGTMGINLSSDIAAWGFRIYLYDENLKPIKTEPDPMGYVYRSSNTLNFNTKGYYVSGVLLKNLDMSIRNPDKKLKYIQIYVESGASGTWFETVAVSIQYLRQNRRMYSYVTNKPIQPIVSGAVSQGFARKGEFVLLDAGGYYLCTFSSDMEIAANGILGDTVVYFKGESAGNSGVIAAGSTVNEVILNNGSTADDFHNNSAITVNGELRYIIDYVGSTKKAVLNQPLTAATEGMTYVMYNNYLAINDVIGILLDDLSTHWTTVQAVDKSKITLTNALPSSTSTNRRVVANRWALKNI